MNVDSLSKMATSFYKLAQQTAQIGDLESSLDAAGLLGRVRGTTDFDVNSNVANVIFGVLDAASYKGKISTSITVQPNAAVTIDVQAAVPQVAAAVQKALQNSFGRKMTSALLAAKIVPAQSMRLPWLTQVGY